MIQHAYFSTNPGITIENWNDDYARLIMNPVERTFINTVGSNDPEDETGELHEETVTEWEAETLLIPKPITYSSVVEALIRTRYTLSDELSFLRQKDTKPDEFEIYNLFIEECKDIARQLNL